MYSISRIQQVLKAVPQGAFDQIVQRHGGDRRQALQVPDQLVAMLYVQLAGAQSLRELQAGFNAQTRHHYHLGTGRVAIDAVGGQRQAQSADLCRAAEAADRAGGPALRRERSELLYLLDATTVPLPPRCSQECVVNASKRGNHGMKLHVQFEAGSPAVAAARDHDVQGQRHHRGAQPLCPDRAGATYVFDNGYCHYNWWHSIDQKGATFVTRFRRDAALTFKRERRASQSKGILRDSVVAFALRTPRGGHRNSYSTPLRRIEVHRPDQAPLVLATNDLAPQRRSHFCTSSAGQSSCCSSGSSSTCRSDASWAATRTRCASGC